MRHKLIGQDSSAASAAHARPGGLILAAAAVAASAVLRFAIDPFVHDDAPLLIFAFGVVTAGLYGGFGAGIIATLLSIPVSDYLFVQPRHTFFVHDARIHLVMQIAFAVLGVLLSGIIERLNRTREHLRRTAAGLYEANAKLVENDRQLAASEERFRMATDAGKEAIWEWNIVARTVARSDTYAMNYGRPGDGESGLEWWQDRIHPEEREAVVESLWTAVDGKDGTWSSKYRFRRIDGTWAHIHDRACIARKADGKACRAIGAMLDITETVLAREALQESELRLSTLAAMVPEILYTATPDGTPDYVSKRFADYSGRSVAELQGQGWMEVVHPDDRRAAATAWINSVQTGVEYEVSYRLQRADGVYRWFQGHAAPMLGPEGKVQKWFGIFTDIHDRKVLELDLSQRSTQLLRSNERLNRFAYAVSHDLQEPLRMIGSYTQLLARRNEGKLDADSDQFIRFVLDGTDRMRRLIHDLLEYSRTGNEPLNEKVPTDANFVLGLALEHLQSNIKESGASITFDNLPVVWANQNLLIRVFQNLISNAIKYSDEPLAEIHVSGRREADEWIFSIRDNGIGIDPEYHEQIFEPFRRLRDKKEATGTGVGLAICKQIVERHGGRMWVESTKGKGSTFIFTIPEGPVDVSVGAPIGSPLHIGGGV